MIFVVERLPLLVQMREIRYQVVVSDSYAHDDERNVIVSIGREDSPR